MKSLWPFSRSKATSADKPEDDKQAPEEASDPLDSLSRSRSHRKPGWAPTERPETKLVTVDDFEFYDPNAAPASTVATVGDSALATTAQDGPGESTVTKGNTGSIGLNSYTVPEQLMSWYASQSFIGYQACALIAQHWLVDKACTMSGEDAIRNGWEIKTDGTELTDEQLSDINEIDVKFRIKENLSELNRFRNIFGIRVAIFQVESDDPEYYEKPFNPDGVTKGSYQGISQVDPYWMTPLMTAQSTSDPASIHFYEPEFWVISGRKYHRSHLVIVRGPQPADILKPTYIFGGIPLTQRIYERVYAAERTANEAPLLALNKRTTTLHVDTGKALLNEESFFQKILLWVKYRDNHAVKVLGKDETMEQFDTSLADFDSVIMNQYQLVAAIAKTPATKILGTSPKGFNATGEFESVSYHEELESIQEHTMDPMLDRHYTILMRHLGLDQVCVQVIWNSVDSISTTAKADLNLKKAQTDEINVNTGAVSPDEVRQRLRDDPHAGYNRLTDDTASEQPGMSPENLAELEKAGAEKQKFGAQAQAIEATGAPTDPEPTGAPPKPVGSVAEANAAEEAALPTPEVEQVAPKPAPDANAVLAQTLLALSNKLDALVDVLTPEGKDIEFDASPGVDKTAPGVKGSTSPSVAGLGANVEARPTSGLQTIKLRGIVTAIENPRGSIRQGKDGSWKIKMQHHYGFIKNTKGADGEEVDCFVGPNLKSNSVFVVNQVNKEGAFDEHKCMLGFDSQQAAQDGYNSSFKPGWDGMGSVVPMDMASFRKWLETADLTQPAVVPSNGV